jgi:hypothetical protein
VTIDEADGARTFEIEYKRHFTVETGAVQGTGYVVPRSALLRAARAP